MLLHSWTININMSWISPTFSDHSGSSTSAPKKRKTVDITEVDISSDVSFTSTSPSNWLQKYCPSNLEGLAVNVKKVNELQSWLEQSCSKTTSKFLLLSGSSGCGKTTTLQVLCRRLGLKIREWITPLDKPDYEYEFVSQYEFSKSTAKQFEEYLFRSSRYVSCLGVNTKKNLVLVKDFPNVFIHNPSTFHDILERFSEVCLNPVVFICSDESLCRKLFPLTIKSSCKIQCIIFNPIPDQRLIKVLKGILQQECKHNKNINMLAEESLYSISSASQGDLRSAITKLYFSTVNSRFDAPKLKSNRALKKAAQYTKEPVLTDKDQRIDFFHGVGRVLYPKKIETDKGLNFVHSTAEIVETFLCEPNNFINQLHENYPGKLASVYDLSVAAERLSNSDILMSRWQEKDIFQTYSLSVAVQGLMVSNKTPQKAKFEAFRKTQTSRAVIDSKSLELEGKSVFSELCILDYGSLLDILPFSMDLLPNLNSGQIEYIRRVCNFKKV